MATWKTRDWEISHRLQVQLFKSKATESAATTPLAQATPLPWISNLHSLDSLGQQSVAYLACLFNRFSTLGPTLHRQLGPLCLLFANLVIVAILIPSKHGRIGCFLCSRILLLKLSLWLLSKTSHLNFVWKCDLESTLKIEEQGELGFEEKELIYHEQVHRGDRSSWI